MTGPTQCVRHEHRIEASRPDQGDTTVLVTLPAEPPTGRDGGRGRGHPNRSPRVQHGQTTPLSRQALGEFDPEALVRLCGR